MIATINLYSQNEKKIQFVSGVSQVCQSQWWLQANVYFNVAGDDNLRAGKMAIDLW